MVVCLCVCVCLFVFNMCLLIPNHSNELFKFTFSVVYLLLINIHRCLFLECQLRFSIFPQCVNSDIVIIFIDAYSNVLSDKIVIMQMNALTKHDVILCDL
jgi:hypothetical protein